MVIDASLHVMAYLLVGAVFAAAVEAFVGELRWGSFVVAVCAWPLEILFVLALVWLVVVVGIPMLVAMVLIHGVRRWRGEP